MANINRDYIIELLLQLPQYNKKFEILPSAKPLQFYKHDRNQTIYIVFHGWKEEGLTLKMAIKNTETKHIIEYYPDLLGQQEGDTIFKLDISDDILAQPGKYEFQAFLEAEDGTITSSNIDSFRVKDCL